MNSLSQIRNVAILGSTGSIGRAALDVVLQTAPQFRLSAISCHRQIDLFESQIAEYSPRYAIVTGDHNQHLDSWKSMRSHPQTRRQTGMEQLVTLVQSDEVDIVVGAIVGIAGLESSLAAVNAGKRLALANKESLVVAGALLMESAKSSGAEILPVDSEHSAIFQCLQAGRNVSEVEKIILTASGGPLRDWPVDQLSNATVENALSHPTWQMGRKITVDSATMMNKALEVIEAKWLFGVEPEQISVVVHPQSIIHSMVEFRDGSVLGQMSPPDMRLPIQYALTYPARLAGPSPKLDWSQAMQLDWKPADFERYPALELGFEVAKNAGTCGAVLNAANEAAVELFLDRKIKLTEITTICRQVLGQHHYSPTPTLSELFELDRWGRAEVQRWITAKC
ncbi:MAG: 1-deoxy-D-xylulose-5-phosphate reductoisomerase [Pirellula sp.]